MSSPAGQLVLEVAYLRQPGLLLLPLGVLQGLLPLHRLLSLHLQEKECHQKVLLMVGHLVIVELCEVVDDDGDGQRHDQHPADGTARPYQLTQA